MEPALCFHCAVLFTPRNKKQYYCPRPECRRARKAAWQRIKTRADPDYRAAKRLSQKKWAANHPGYWKAYRNRNPEKAERNRMLQTIRNRRRFSSTDVLIAKLDATKVNIYTMSSTWP